MLTTVDLVEDWIQIRATLQKQLKALESEAERADVGERDSSNIMIAARLRTVVAELTGLLKEHARDSRA